MPAIQVADHFTVAVTAKVDTVAFELATQLRIVVDLAVVENDDAAGLVVQRLRATDDVDDAEAAHAGAVDRITPIAGRVGAAVDQALPPCAARHRRRRLTE